MPWTGGLSHLGEPRGFANFLKPLYERQWNVYAKPPTGSPQQVLKYLARYTHRVAISNERIESISDDGHVTFTYKDSTRGGRVRRMTLSADEFQGRLLQHVLPKGFVRLRGFGLLANGVRKRNLARCRELLGDVDCTTAPNELAPGEPSGDSDAACPDAESLPRCVHCGQPALRPTAVLPRPTVAELVARTYPRPLLDSS